MDGTTYRMAPPGRSGIEIAPVPFPWPGGTAPSMLAETFAPGGSVVGVSGRDLHRLRIGVLGALSPDESFGDAGLAPLVPPPYVTASSFPAVPRRVFADDRGRTYVVSHVSLRGEENLLVQRYSANGRLDTAFGGGGVLLPVAGDPQYVAVAMALSRRILAVALEDPTQTRIVRFGENGLDDTFGVGGQIALARGTRSITELAVLPDGGLIVAIADGVSIGVRRLRRDGRFDPGYAGNGEARFTAGQWFGRPADGIVASDVRVAPNGAAFVLLIGDTTRITRARSMLCKLTP
jgi:hypothetical protein